MKFSNLLPDLSFHQPSLADSFQRQHERYFEAFPGWSLQGTRRKLVGFYWIKIVLKHYLVLLVISSVMVLLFGQQPIRFILTGLVPASMLVFAVLFLSMYWPIYKLEFLPHLDNWMENYKGHQLEGIQQCKKQQYSVVSLMLIQHVYMEMAGMETPLINTSNAQLFARQYGVSVKSISPALLLILRGDWNRKSVRKQTEIADDFETAKEYFRELSEHRAIQLLDKLQQKILQ